MLDPRILFQFVAVAQTLSFTTAARQLRMTQPRLSAQIQRLEAELGMVLFDRTTRSVRLTSRGAEFLAMVRPAMDGLRDVLDQIEDMRSGKSAIIRIGCPQLGSADRHQAVLLARFTEARPGYVVDVQAGVGSSHLDRMCRGDLDLALLLVAPDEEGWDTIALYPATLAAVMHHDDPLARLTTPIAPIHFAGRRVATFARRRMPDLYDQLYAGLAAAGADLFEVPELRRSILRERPDSIVSTIVTSAADAPLMHGLVRRAIAAPVAMHISLVRRHDAVRSIAADRFWKWVAEAYSAD